MALTQRDAPAVMEPMGLRACAPIMLQLVVNRPQRQLLTHLGKRRHTVLRVQPKNTSRANPHSFIDVSE